MRWIYPLLRLEYGALKALTEAEECEIEMAVKTIKHIDFKTVSIVEFENILLKTKTKPSTINHQSHRTS